MTVAPAPSRVPSRIPRRVPAEEAAPRHLHLVEPDARRRQERRRRWAMRGWAWGIVLAAFLGVGVHALMAQGQLAVDRLDGRIAAEQRRVDEARLRVATLESPALIVQRAAGAGLVAANGARVVTVAPETPAPGVDALREWQSTKPNLGSTP